MARTKRKRGGGATEAVTSSRKRRAAAAGHEPSEEEEVEQQEEEPQQEQESPPQPALKKQATATTAAAAASPKKDATTTTTRRASAAATSTSAAAPADANDEGNDHAGYDNADDNNDTAAAREEGIRTSLQHRQLLLQRVRQGRRAAQQHLDSLPTAQQQITEEQETAAFAEMTKTVSAQARKQARLEAAAGASAADATERRSSVSLRHRGASVGKRMNAAISSLSSGGTAAAAGGGSGTGTAPLTALAPTHAGSIISAAAIAAAAAAAGPSSASSPTTSSIIAAAGVPLAAAPTTHKIASAMIQPKTATTGAPKGRPSSAAGRGGGGGANRKQQQQQAGGTAGRGPYSSLLQQQNQQRRNAAAAVGGGLSLSGGPPRQAPSAAQTGPPRYAQTAPPPPPRVICPETLALRERRDALRIRLATMVQERQSRLEHAGSAAAKMMDGGTATPSRMREQRRSSSMSMGTTTGVGAAGSLLSRYTNVPASPSSTTLVGRPQLGLPPQQQKQQQQQQQQRSSAGSTSRPTWRGPDPQPQLPSRRKTHWDTLLEEMRWLATDFIEERKWKHATARMMGNLAVASRKLSPEQQQGDETETAAAAGSSNQAEAATIVEGGENKNVNETNNDVDAMEVDAEESDSKETRAKVEECYKEVTEEDEKTAREVATTISKMIAELALSKREEKEKSEPHWSSSSSLSTPPMGEDEEEQSALAVEAATNGEAANDSLPGDPSALPTVTSENMEPNKDGEQLTISKTEALDRASKFVDKILNELKCGDAGSKSKSASKHKAGIDYGIQLLDGQTSVVKTVQDRWQRLKVGAVLRGTVASGKTIAACSLLWKHRSSGPQLLLCSSASMIRWLHELGRFPDLNLKVLDASRPVLADKSLPEYGENDIIIGQYGSIAQMKGGRLGKFCSIVIDCRHPTGYAGSRSPSVVESDDIPSTFSRRDRAAPIELSSTTWWGRIVDATTGGDNVNRLLVDNPGVDDSLHYLRGLSNREFLGVQALRVGFLFGTSGFASPVYYSIEKAVLAWSRHKIKESAESGSKFRRVSKLLATLGKPFCCSINSAEKLEEIDFSGSELVSWEVQPCEMGYSQRMAYDTVCNDVRSALSRSLGVRGPHPDSDPFTTSALALLRVRRQCAHSDIDGTIRTARIQVPRNASPLQSAGANSSQPNVELARRILGGSSKLQQLVSILVQDCGLEIVQDEAVSALLTGASSARKSSKSQKKSAAKKVAILAALPDIQILVSVLLDAVGVDHEVLLRPSSSSSDAVSDSMVGAAAWARSQLVLSRFNGDESTWRSDVNVVVASPLSVAGDHGGLGVEHADTIVCLDEDWSGRGELLLLSLVARCQRQREANGEDGCRVVRLVAQNTCEETFLTSTGSKIPAAGNHFSQNGKCNEWPWSLDELGSFVPPAPAAAKGKSERIQQCWLSRPTGEQHFSFPGRNLFSSCDQELDEVLCSRKRLPRFLSSASKLRFLPVFEDETTVEFQMMFLQTLLREEDAACSWSCRGTPFLSSLAEALIPLLPPFAPEFPKGFVERIDLPCAASRLFFERVSDNGFAVMANGSAIVQLGDAQGIKGGNLADDTTALMEPEFTVTERDPVESASSILFYHPDKKSDQPLSAATIPRRENFYAAMFSSVSSSSEIHDGNQGFEALVYFPPIFPRMQECAVLAKADVDSLWSRNTETAANEQIVTIGPESEADEDGKLPATEPVAKRPRLLDPNRVITEDEASQSDAASVLMDLSDDYGLAGMGAVPLPRDSALSAAHYTANVTGSSTTIAVQAQNEWLASNPLCDPEEFNAAAQTNPGDTASGSMILFVSRKRPRGFAGTAASSMLGRGLASGSGAWNGVAQAVLQDLNGTGPKGKKSSAFKRLPMPGSAQARPASQQYQRDAYRYRLLTNLRQSGIGSTIFEAPIFRVAAVRVRNKVSDRLLRYGWTSSAAFDIGPGLPLLISKPHTPSSPQYRGMFDVDPNLWTSIVKRLKNKDAVTGGEAIELSFAQRSALRRSLVAPCRVDFGPFHCGFLSSPTGMTVVAPPRPRVGVSLPMGVKITHAEKDLGSQGWSSSDDQKLQDSAVRFGMNWIVAARVLSGCQDLLVYSQPESSRFLPQRAARGCRDRWQRLARSNPSMVMKVRQSDRFTFSADRVPKGGDPGRRVSSSREHDTQSDDKSKKEATILLLPPTDHDGVPNRNESEKIADTSVPLDTAGSVVDDDEKMETSSPPRRRSFAAFKSAKTKRKIPPSIPGVASGSVPVVAPSHPSHEQSVQASVAASRPNGGATDMWPLQLLDIADRQRAAAAAAAAAVAAKAPPGASVSSRQESVSSTNSRGANSLSLGSRNHVGSGAQAIRRASSSAAGGAPSLAHQSGVGHMPLPPRAAVPGSPIRKSSASTISATAKQSFVPPPASTVAKQSFAPPPTASAAKDAATTQSAAAAAAATGAAASDATAATKDSDDRGRPGQS